MSLVERWGLVATVPDGEDRSSRHKVKSMPPEQVVDRAMAISNYLVDQMTKQGWLITEPGPELLYAEDPDG